MNGEQLLHLVLVYLASMGSFGFILGMGHALRVEDDRPVKFRLCWALVIAPTNCMIMPIMLVIYLPRILDHIWTYGNAFPQLDK